MTTHRIGTRDEWLAARRELLAAEKEVTRKSDELAKRRQALPWVRVDQDYRLATDDGTRSLKDMFRGRSQLIIYHFMFGPDFSAGGPSGAAIADGFDRIAVHLANHDVMLWAVSRAPLPKLQAYKRRMGWSFPWASAFESDFNADFGVFHTDEEMRTGRVEYNFRTAKWPPRPIGEERAEDRAVAADAGTDWATFTRERPGMSTFVLEAGVVYHAYSSYSRGLDGLWSMYQWLDRAPKGRNEDAPGMWWRRHDEYAK
jgi:predicted dithiol-disulfide oxidoreductase (DUF899 family)